MNVHDPIKHSTYLKQALAQDKLPIGFFIAAGCPLSVEMPKDKWPLIPDVAGLTKHVDEILSNGIKDGSYKTLVDEIKKSGFEDYNIEDLLTFVRSLKDVSKGGTVRGLNEKQLLNIEKEVCKEISNKVAVDLPETDNPYRRFANWIQSIEREIAVEVFTTNYDLLLEQALEDTQVPYFDGFVGSNKSFFDLRSVEDREIPKHWTRLWKIHGSLNWFKDEKNQVFRGMNRSDEEDNLHLIYPSHLKYDQSRKMPFLAMIDQLHKFISKQNSILFLSGYSFSDEHLNNVIVSALKANPRSSVFTLLYDKLEKYPNAYKLAQRCSNLSLFALDKAIIGTVEGDWHISQELIELDSHFQNLLEVSDDKKEEGTTTPVSFKIGDFNTFSLFLKHLIGKEDMKNV